ncbi:hypothetical protein ACNQVK_00030 [Mycobacterium sp. 134]|uniref:hypothetical protein n=1 Tax=Mycobacterium sp. 134 TaxID=3400425 RepID=UPI003AB081FB
MFGRGQPGRRLREAADLAESGVTDINAAHREIVAAITAAEEDDFNVSEELKATDTRRYDITTIAARNRALAEHTEDIRWYADRLVQPIPMFGNGCGRKRLSWRGLSSKARAREV